MHDPANGFLRIHLLRGWVNKVRRAGAQWQHQPSSITVLLCVTPFYEPSLTSVISSAPKPWASR